MNNYFPQYTTDYISGVMSLRTPQKDSLKILEEIVNSVSLRKGMNLKAALGAVHAMYPTCSDFEREFMSLTFALATGVGKTRLMGAFIAYLYTQHGIKNFFVVAPNTTIYDKLKKDLSDHNSPKYVFKGLGCFSTPPQIITDDDYKEKTISMYESDIRVFIYNIDKFNKETANMKKLNEVLGDSFYQYLSNLPDLVLIMDESHHYRAEKGAQALNDLNPLLGLELTATPLVTKGTKQVPFKNVVFEYPLSRAIADGYTRTPFAVTRSDIDFYNFGDEQLDKMMLLDGIACHERAKAKLKVYADNHPDKRLVKPFMLVVCKDTNHAAWVEGFIKSDEFRSGAYRNKTIIVHSKQKGAETEANTRLLLDVESAENPVEIVIHVNMLKEGWDVNNLYTIVPLRTAASKILREQMVGRGLRLPYGERTGDRDVDAVMLTAHDKFNDILEEAKRGDSIFKAGNVIQAEEIVPEQISHTQLTIELEPDKELEKAYEHTQIEHSEAADTLIKTATETINTEVTHYIQNTPEHTVTTEQARQIAEVAKQKLSEDKDLGDVFRENEMPLTAWLLHKTEETHRAAQAKFIPIPRIKVTDTGVEEYVFVDFDLDMTDFTHVPIRNELLIQNLEDMQDRMRIQGDAIDFDGFNPKKVILQQLRVKPEIDYEKCSALLFKLISQVCDHYENQHGVNGMQNIVMMYKRDIENKIYKQMMQHFYCENGFLQEEVIGTRNYNLSQSYAYEEKTSLFGHYSAKIQSVLFTDIKKGVFSSAKFDSLPELLLARVLETDNDVLNWLRPAPHEFNITYNRGHNYEPDFVVETESAIYIYGLTFTTDKFYPTERISFENFVFSSKRGENSIRKDWFDSSRDTSWWNDDQKYDPNISEDDNRILIKHPTDTSWQLYFRWCGTRRADCIAETKMLNLDSFNQFCYDMNNDKATDVYLILTPFSGDEPQWSVRRYVKIGTAAQGSSTGVFDLSASEEIKAAANSENSIYIIGIAFGLENFEYGNVINVNDIYFAPKHVTSTASFESQGGGISKASDSATVTLTANVQTTGDTSVIYKWYVDGVQADETDSVFTVTNDTEGEHTVYGVVCVGDNYYTAARYVSETVSYAAYTVADISMDGEINAEDLSILRAKLVTGEAFTDIEKLSADINCDGKTDILDLVKTKKLIAG